MTEVDINRRLSLAGLGAAALMPLVVGTAAAQTASGSVMDRIMSEKKFKIGYIPSPPSIIKDPASGEIRGFSVDAMRYVCSALKVEPVLVETTWANFVSGLNSNQFDLCIAGTFATIVRAGAVQFTKPIWYLGYSAVVKKDDTRFAKPSDLNREGIRIALIQGGASVEYAKENWPKAEKVLLSHRQPDGALRRSGRRQGRCRRGRCVAGPAFRRRAARRDQPFRQGALQPAADQLVGETRQPGCRGVHEQRHRLPHGHRPVGEDGRAVRSVGPLLRQAATLGLRSACLARRGCDPGHGVLDGRPQADEQMLGERVKRRKTSEVAGTRNYHPFPKYLQIRDVILRWLASREVGERLPTEMALSDQFGVSRETIRKSLQRLEQNGIIRRRQRAGTFLAKQPAVNSDLRLTGPIEEFKDLGTATTAKLVKSAPGARAGRRRWRARAGGRRPGL